MTTATKAANFMTPQTHAPRRRFPVPRALGPPRRPVAGAWRSTALALLQWKNAIHQGSEPLGAACRYCQRSADRPPALRHLQRRWNRPRPQWRLHPSWRTLGTRHHPGRPHRLPIPYVGVRLRHRRIRLRPHQARPYLRSRAGRRRRLPSGALMRELPEVETVVRSIRPLVGRRIVTAEFRNLRVLRGGDPDAMSARLAGRKITGV